MQAEEDIPLSCRLRVYLHGPLQVWKRNADGTWTAVSKEEWGKGRPTRSVLKRLLATPGRRLSRGRLQEDLWPDIDFELADKYLYNAMSVIRTVLGKELVKSWDFAYELADQSLLWLDIDACECLLKAAEDQGCTSTQALLLVERALSYLERGEFLEGESGAWCYGLRKKSEDMLRQARLWLAEGYAAQGKLWQAGEQYRALLQTAPPDEEALQRWIIMLYKQGKTQEALKCYQDMKGLIEAQGFTLSNAIEQVVAPLDKQPTMALLSPVQQLRDILEEQDMRRMSRRHALQQILGIASLAQFPLLFFSTVTTQKDSIEEYLSLCEENILACWRLMKGNEIAVVPSVLCTWLPSLEPLARQSTPYQKQSAALSVQGYIIAGLVRVLHRDYKGAEWCCKQALEYSEIAEDDNLKIAAFKHLATKYNDAGYHLKTLRVYQEALSSMDQASPLLQSRIYLGLALSYAHCQEKQEALRYWELAQESFPEQPEYDPSFVYADCGKSSLNHYGGLMYLEFGQPDKAWEVFQEVVELQQQTMIPERTVIEIVNCKAEAAIAQKNLDLACAHLQEGVQGAIRLKSEMRFHDAVALYQKARAIWPHEQALRELEELFH